MIRQVVSMAVAALLLAAPAFAGEDDDRNVPRGTDVEVHAQGDNQNAPRFDGDPNVPRFPGVEN